MQGDLDFHSPRRGTSHFDWSFEHQFNSSSRTLSEEIGQWVLLMWGVRTLWWAITTDKTIKLKICIPDVAYCSIIATTRRWNHVSRFSGIKVKLFYSSTFVYICLHSSSDWSTLVHIRLVTRLHSSTFIFISLWLVYIRLHSSTLV